MHEKIAIIGPKDLILGLRAFDIDTFFAEGGDTALNFLKTIKSDGRHGMVLVVKEVLDKIPENEFKKISASPLPAILAIPGIKAHGEDYILKLKKLAEKAIGSDILK